MKYNKYEKGTIGWLKEQAKKDGFDDLNKWNEWKRYKRNVKNIGQINIYDKKEFTYEEREIFYHFWSKVDIKDNNRECWNWTGRTNRDYGAFSSTKTTEQCAHRMAYMLTKGVITDGLEVQHLCNNTRCCNPNHLELGDHSKNMRYRSECGRYNNSGENNGNSRLTEADVRKIHMIYKERRKLYPELRQWEITEPIAEKFKFSNIYINRIIRGGVWHHIYEEFIRS